MVHPDEADLTTTDANPPRRMTARAGDAMLPAESLKPHWVCSSGGLRGGGGGRLTDNAGRQWRGQHEARRFYGLKHRTVQVHVGFETGTPTHPRPRPCLVQVGRVTGPGTQVPPPSFFKRRTICCPQACHEFRWTCPAWVPDSAHFSSLVSECWIMAQCWGTRTQIEAAVGGSIRQVDS